MDDTTAPDDPADNVAVVHREILDGGSDATATVAVRDSSTL
ncbi:hypothetical protein [Natrinema salaciae]|nr:hypothetical protein [Natrinema salaciae]